MNLVCTQHDREKSGDRILVSRPDKLLFIAEKALEKSPVIE